MRMQVQHAGLRDSCTADTLTVEFLVRAVKFLFPDFNYEWLVDEIKENLPRARPCFPAKSHFPLGAAQMCS
jgi:aarF domain-containing kinase